MDTTIALDRVEERRMFADKIQDLAHIDETGTVHLQGINCRTSR